MHPRPTGPKVEITKNRPYKVSGQLPLSKQAGSKSWDRTVMRMRSGTA
jgi:hypothetical protein